MHGVTTKIIRIKFTDDVPTGIQSGANSSAPRTVAHLSLPPSSPLLNPRLQASTAKYMRTALFWALTQCVVVVPYRRFGTAFRSHLKGSRIATESRLSQYGVCKGKSGGGDKLSVACCQPIGHC